MFAARQALGVVTPLRPLYTQRYLARSPCLPPLWERPQSPGDGDMMTIAMANDVTSILCKCIIRPLQAVGCAIDGAFTSIVPHPQTLSFQGDVSCMRRVVFRSSLFLHVSSSVLSRVAGLTNRLRRDCVTVNSSSSLGQQSYPKLL